MFIVPVRQQQKLYPLTFGSNCVNLNFLLSRFCTDINHQHTQRNTHLLRFCSVTAPKGHSVDVCCCCLTALLHIADAEA